MTAPQPERFAAFEALDRLAITELRPPTSPSGVVAPFYELARAGAREPLSRQVAAAIRAAGEAADAAGNHGKALIVTGLVDTDRFPRGEIDGPIGSIALGRALLMLGFEVTIIVDAEAHGPIVAVLATAGVTGIELRTGDFTSAADAEAYGAGFDVVIAVEKLGRNSKGVKHLIWGTPCEIGDPYSDDYVLGASAAGRLTVGVGDNGNEIGFGSLPAAAGAITPNGLECNCPCHGGIMAATACDFLVPASVSNIGCYVLAAALAIMSGRQEVSPDGATIAAWTERGLDEGLRSGGVDDPTFRGDDGIPVRYVAAQAELIHGVVHQAVLGDAWSATDVEEAPLTGSPR